MKLTRRMVLGSIAIAGASAGMGVGSVAYLSDQANSDISINVGSLELSDPAPIEWEEDPSTDGEDSFSDAVSIENAGNLPARQVILHDVSMSDTGLAQALEITDIRYGVASPTSILEDIEANNNGNGLYDLDDLAQSTPIALKEAAGSEVLHADDAATLEIDAQIDYSQIPDEKDGAELAATLTVRGQQEATS